MKYTKVEKFQMSPLLQHYHIMDQSIKEELKLVGDSTNEKEWIQQKSDDSSVTLTFYPDGSKLK